jgi:hypothetical protein
MKYPRVHVDLSPDSRAGAESTLKGTAKNIRVKDLPKIFLLINISGPVVIAGHIVIFQPGMARIGSFQTKIGLVFWYHFPFAAHWRAF